MVASINWAVMRSRLPDFRTLPSSKYLTPNSLLTCCAFTARPLCETPSENPQARPLVAEIDEPPGQVGAAGGQDARLKRAVTSDLNAILGSLLHGHSSPRGRQASAVASDRPRLSAENRRG